MTDKEMAEEYANQSCFTEMANPSLSESVDISDDIKQAFLAGLKAGKDMNVSPKWHILAEEPNILPKEGQKVRVLIEEGTIEESTLFYDTYYEELAWSNIGLVKVFAWCEIPKYTEE